MGARVAHRVRADLLEGDGYHPSENLEKMTKVIPLTDADRRPSLQELTRLLAERDRVVISCSALKRDCCDILRRANHARFLYLHISREVAADRLRRRVRHCAGPGMVESSSTRSNRARARSTPAAWPSGAGSTLVSAVVPSVSAFMLAIDAGKPCHASKLQTGWAMQSAWSGGRFLVEMCLMVPSGAYSPTSRRLVILGCSATKVQTDKRLPAIDLYDGPTYRVLRNSLRQRGWPLNTSVAVLSARHGLIGGLSMIGSYDQRMSAGRARELQPQVRRTVHDWSSYHTSVDLVLGRDYLPAIETALTDSGLPYRVAEGPIGMKLHFLKDLLESIEADAADRSVERCFPSRIQYFLPDWDDFVDADFDFAGDAFSSPNRSERNQIHVTRLAGEPMCDGLLVTLGQRLSTKGMLRAPHPTSIDALAPADTRARFGLSREQPVFGDCGAFTYVGDPEPAVSTTQALDLYELYKFDLGASVDHIAAAAIRTGETTKPLSTGERKRRVAITTDNAEEMIALTRRRKSSVSPVGVVQAIKPADYGKHLRAYVEMGYERVALGGLVPRSDAEVLEAVESVAPIVREHDLRLHLFGVFRPTLQDRFRNLGVSSIDSATYFRKAWLRSDQNYLSSAGEWFAAIRVPMTSDARTMKRLAELGTSPERAQALEAAALEALHRYGSRELALDECVRTVTAYDQLLARNERDAEGFEARSRRTLLSRPWESCECDICTAVGIDVLIFRGLNRNKRRGAHNTLMLYRQLQS